MNIFTLLNNRPFVASVLMHYVLFMLLYIMIRICVLFITHKRAGKGELRYFFGMLYINFVLALTFTPVDFTLNIPDILSRIQLIPFDTVTRFWPLDGEYSLYNIIGNVLLMIPILPVLTYNFKMTSIKTAAAFTAVFIICIEVGQLFFTTTRICDIDDFILNMLGFFLSALLWNIIKKVRIAS